MLKTFEIDKKSCITCEYYNINRSVEFQNQRPYIAHDTTQGKCRVRNNCLMTFFVVIPCKEYKRWHQLP